MREKLESLPKGLIRLKYFNTHYYAYSEVTGTIIDYGDDDIKFKIDDIKPENNLTIIVKYTDIVL
jgi:hypothetical protein